MKIHFHSLMDIFIQEAGRLPLYVTRVDKRPHPAGVGHIHSFVELVLITGGQARHLAGDNVSPISAGDVLVIPPGTPHCYEDTGNMKLINIIYDARQLSLPLPDAHELPLFHRFFPESSSPGSKDAAAPVARLEDAPYHAVITLIDRLESEVKNVLPGNLTLAVALFTELLVLIARQSGFENAGQRTRFQIGEAVQLMHKSFREGVSVDVLARSAHMSRRNFFRHFKQTTGLAPAEYLMALRLRLSCELLRDTDESIGEIAGRCGFCDGNFFAKKFREQYRMTPREFRSAKKLVCLTE